MDLAESGPGTEPELTEPVDLCTPDGRRTGRRSAGRGRLCTGVPFPDHGGRRKRWDYWCIATPTHVLSVTFADVDYLALADVWFLDAATGRSAGRSALAPLARGVSLLDRVAGTSMSFEARSLRLAIAEEAGGTGLVIASGRRGPPGARVAERRHPVDRPPLPMHDEGQHPAGQGHGEVGR